MSTLFSALVYKTVFLLTLVSVAIAASTNITIDNTSPQVVYSPTPCFEDTPTACSIEWIQVQSPEAFNGSVTSTDGPLPDASNISVSILPRVTLNFNGSGIIFVPGPNSIANASITLDDLPSIIIDTSKQNYQNKNLQSPGPHTLVIEYEPNLNDQSQSILGSDTLEIDFFIVIQDEQISSSTTSPPIPPTSTSTPSSTLTSSRTTETSQGTPAATSSSIVVGSTDRPSLGTIIAIVISAVALFLVALLAWFLGAKHQRRRRAIKRENAILSGMKMPSETDDVGNIWPGGIHIWKGKGKQTLSDRGGWWK
ncbi:hypothetical protein Clacol_005633 [Clathrus columnatus]|uniref:Uncharacterized protein n=1 Tax=Clathrus columnatus TaxID=1419009 RepID=A0AAV5AAN6_9AGAM|nr:hypothetical protein Clacol_005633 [Clathrus columnatus]